MKRVTSGLPTIKKLSAAYARNPFAFLASAGRGFKFSTIDLFVRGILQTVQFDLRAEVLVTVIFNPSHQTPIELGK
jgi:hypothetical protein